MYDVAFISFILYFGKSGYCIVPTEANILSGQKVEKRDCPDEIETIGNHGFNIRNVRLTYLT